MRGCSLAKRSVCATDHSFGVKRTQGMDAPLSRGTSRSSPSSASMSGIFNQPVSVQDGCPRSVRRGEVAAQPCASLRRAGMASLRQLRASRRRTPAPSEIPPGLGAGDVQVRRIRRCGGDIGQRMAALPAVRVCAARSACCSTLLANSRGSEDSIPRQPRVRRAHVQSEALALPAHRHSWGVEQGSTCCSELSAAIRVEKGLR